MVETAIVTPATVMENGADTIVLSALAILATVLETVEPVAVVVNANPLYYHNPRKSNETQKEP